MNKKKRREEEEEVARSCLTGRVRCSKETKKTMDRHVLYQGKKKAKKLFGNDYKLCDNESLPNTAEEDSGHGRVKFSPLD